MTSLAGRRSIPQGVLADPDGVFFGGGQAIMRLDRGWAAASEPRMDGMAAGH